ncbi:tctex1 domain-containing protein 1-B [Aplysia californica]|uniref:Tctex1 domain-containing protein 1-B n=1 Tax=Aplysia californica TaxID=6500 RepID=A0ABM0K8V4_APLCA|nr:tctex1 domain-containing protein 1-B [Aplysia californica]XP_005111591.1 tctex1 domain-containing protein 1-B [Aplysia californica]
MSDRDVARDKAARLLKKQGSVSSFTSSEAAKHDRAQKVGHLSNRSVSSVSFMDEPGHDDHYHAPVKFENTYQLEPAKRFPYATVRSIIKESMENLLSEEQYRPDFCRDMSKTLSDTIKARVKSLMIPRYKIICLVQIGELKAQGMRVGSRCLWDEANDTFSSHEFRNKSIYAVASVYGVYYE